MNAEVLQGNYDDESDSDSDEILDQAPDLHLSVSEKIKLLLLLAIKKKHKLTYSAAEDIIELSGLSEDLSFLPSKHLMKSAIEKYSFGLQEHHVCPSCGEYIGIVTEQSFECDVCSVETDVDVNKNNGSMFLYLKLKDQLQALLQSLPDNVQLDMNDRKKINCYNYEDIYDGAMYKVFQSSDTITLNFFIDGLQVRVLCFLFLS